MKHSQSTAAWLSIMTIVMILSPVVENWRKNPKDSFPLSHYPMFSQKREAVYGLHYFVGYDSLENRFKIPYKVVGTGGFNQVRRQIRRSAKSDGADAYTERVANRLAGMNKYPYSELVHLELVKGYYHMENYFLLNDTIPTSESLIVSHKIKR